MIPILTKSELIESLEQTARASGFWNDVVYWLLIRMLEKDDPEEILKRFFKYSHCSNNLLGDNFSQILYLLDNVNDRLLDFSQTTFLLLEFFADYGINSIDDLKQALVQLKKVLRDIRHRWQISLYLESVS